MDVMDVMGVRGAEGKLEGRGQAKGPYKNQADSVCHGYLQRYYKYITISDIVQPCDPTDLPGSLAAVGE